MSSADICTTRIAEWYHGWKALNSTKPMVVAISGTQGAGKTTLTAALISRLGDAPYSLRILALSYDDFYLTRAEQEELANTYSNNDLLQVRGQPGTHDVRLGAEIIGNAGKESILKIPVYDKMAHAGKGDRKGWRTVKGPFDLVLFEGWCLGFKSLSAQSLKVRTEQVLGDTQHYLSPNARNYLSSRTESIAEVNDFLRSYEEHWYPLFSCLIHLIPKEIGYVYAWRTEQEQKGRAASGGGMTDDQVIGFVDRYMPAYAVYLPDLTEHPFFGDRSVPHIQLYLDAERQVQDVVEME
ncbi:hypothetical protein BJ742DRAFT_782208 [Cladochytrium replicatum]|nr:hypothetical protein BJ742DRAFT_782208 [Cladochytrium replicatum]